MKRIVVLSLLLGSISGCNKSSSDQKSDPVVYKGYNLDQKMDECTKTEETVCTEIYGEPDAFADACREQGATVFQCGCHSYLCSEVVTSDFRSRLKPN